MSIVQSIFFFFFVVSVFCPIYTYALYPVALRLLRGKAYKVDDIKPSVTVVIVGDDPEEKVRDVQQSSYERFDILTGRYQEALKAKGEIIVFTDTKTRLDRTAIREVVRPFADDRVGCVVGMQTNSDGNSAFWKYENYVKKLESRIGCVSGANEGLFAVRKTDLPAVPETVINGPFFISTKITENGKDVVFDCHAVTWEGKQEGTNFRKHVEAARGYWQAFRLFPKMLIGRHGSFAYFSHRVMKWFVWLNMIMMLVSSLVLAITGFIVMAMIFGMQVIGYMMLMVYGERQIGGPIEKILSIVYYFLMLNVSYFVGLIRSKS